MSKKFGNLKSITLMTVLIILFIAVIAFTAHLVVRDYENDVMAGYTSGEQKTCNAVMDTLTTMLSGDKTEEELISYMRSLDNSGSRFYVLSVNGTVVFARNDETTDGLGVYKDETKFYERIEEQDCEYVTSDYTGEGTLFQVGIVYNPYTVKAGMNISKHEYDIYVLFAVVGLVMLLLMEVILSLWSKNKTMVEQLNDTLLKRNRQLETMSEDLLQQGGEKADLASSEGSTGISTADNISIYNVYTMRELLTKAVGRGMKAPVILYAMYRFGDLRYISKTEFFRMMAPVKEMLTEKEVLGELKKGVFAVFIFGENVPDARIRELKRALTLTGRNKGLASSVWVDSEEEGKTARFDEVRKNEKKESGNEIPTV